MASHIYYRLLGQSVAILLHAGNSVEMLLAMQNEELMRDPEIKTMTSMQSRYFTVWNIGFQLAYFSLAFVCDFLTVIGKDHLLTKSIKKWRQPFFGATVVPAAGLIFIIFWPIFIYDRELLFPAFIDNIFPFHCNFIMHFAILPVVLWEIAFLPRQTPKSHTTNVLSIIFLFVVYNAVIIHTYFKHGLWPYPLFYTIFNTTLYYIFMSIVLVLLISFYYGQWKLSTFFWGNKNKLSKRKVK